MNAGGVVDSDSVYVDVELKMERCVDVKMLYCLYSEQLQVSSLNTTLSPSQSKVLHLFDGKHNYFLA